MRPGQPRGGTVATPDSHGRTSSALRRKVSVPCAWRAAVPVKENPIVMADQGARLWTSHCCGREDQDAARLRQVPEEGRARDRPISCHGGFLMPDPAAIAAAGITVQPTLPATGPAACNHDGTGHKPALQVVLAFRARAPRLRAEPSPGRRAGRPRQAVCTSKEWGLGGRKGPPSASCWLALLLGSAAGSARAAGIPTLAHATPVHRILTRPRTTLGSCPHQASRYRYLVIAASGEVPMRRIAAGHPVPA